MIILSALEFAARTRISARIRNGRVIVRVLGGAARVHVSYGQDRDARRKLQERDCRLDRGRRFGGPVPRDQRGRAGSKARPRSGTSSTGACA